MNKPMKHTVAVILRNQTNPQEFLIVKRPEDDQDLGGHWGLPATTMQPGELPERAAERICREKLGCTARAQRFVGTMFQKRNAYDIVLMDIEMVLSDDPQPDVHAAQTAGTKYAAQKWTTDPSDLMPSAQKGSLCSSIFLTDLGLLERDQWVTSLEGSADVG